MAPIPSSFEDDDQILDPEYFQHDVEKLPILPPTWSCKENTSIWDRFQSILANTNTWMKRRGFKCIKIKPGKDFDPTSLIGLRSEIKGKGKDGTSSSTFEPLVQSLPKLSIKGGKDSRVLEVKEIGSQSIQVDSSDDESRKSKESSPLSSYPLEVLAATSLPDSALVSDESHDSPLGVTMGAFSVKQSSFEDSVPIMPALPVSSAAPALETQGD